MTLAAKLLVWPVDDRPTVRQAGAAPDFYVGFERSLSARLSALFEDDRRAALLREA